MTIIRIEHPDTGFGMFASKLNNKRLCYELSNYSQFSSKHENFPTPSNDSKINRRIKKYEFCAFKSIYQLQKWITKKELKEFISMGFKVYALDVSECIIGKFQIVFEKKNITQSKDITLLFS